MDGELEPTLTPRQLRAKQEAHISDLKNRSVIPALEKMAEELEERAKSGKLAEELKGMKVGSIVNNLTKILASIKTAGLVVVAQTGLPQRNPTALKAQSAVQLSDAQRKLRREAAEATDAEIVDPQ